MDLGHMDNEVMHRMSCEIIIYSVYVSSKDSEIN